jgi:hypothetical protein
MIWHLARIVWAVELSRPTHAQNGLRAGSLFVRTEASLRTVLKGWNFLRRRLMIFSDTVIVPHAGGACLRPCLPKGLPPGGGL